MAPNAESWSCLVSYFGNQLSWDFSADPSFLNDELQSLTAEVGRLVVNRLAFSVFFLHSGSAHV